jgi:hypothetical protein
MTDDDAVDEFYAKTKALYLGRTVTDSEDPTRRGVIVQRGGQTWVSRDKLPWVRWHGKTGSEQVPLSRLTVAL